MAIGRMLVPHYGHWTYASTLLWPLGEGFAGLVLDGGDRMECLSTGVDVEGGNDTALCENKKSSSLTPHIGMR